MHPEKEDPPVKPHMLKGGRSTMVTSIPSSLREKHFFLAITGFSFCMIVKPAPFWPLTSIFSRVLSFVALEKAYTSAANLQV
jgi:hypothetical protein